MAGHATSARVVPPLGVLAVVGAMLAGFQPDAWDADLHLLCWRNWCACSTDSGLASNEPETSSVFGRYNTGTINNPFYKFLAGDDVDPQMKAAATAALARFVF